MQRIPYASLPPRILDAFQYFQQTYFFHPILPPFPYGCSIAHFLSLFSTPATCSHFVYSFNYRVQRHTKDAPCVRFETRVEMFSKTGIKTAPGRPKGDSARGDCFCPPPALGRLTKSLIKQQKPPQALPCPRRFSNMVGVGRLELPASCSQSRRATNCATPRRLYASFPLMAGAAVLRVPVHYRIPGAGSQARTSGKAQTELSATRGKCFGQGLGSVFRKEQDSASGKAKRPCKRYFHTFFAGSGTCSCIFERDFV